MNGLKEIKDTFLEFYKEIINKKKYWLPLVLFCVVAYSFEMMNRTVSLDDLSYSMFAGENHMAIGGYRWGLYILNLFLYTSEYTPFIGRFFALLLLVLDSILFSFLIYLVDKKSKNVLRYTFLSIMFCTYPLINELWYCTGLSVPIQFNGVPFYFLFVFSGAIYLVLNKEFNLRNTIVAGLLLTPAMAGYESVMFAYVTLVFIILYLNNLHKEDKYNWFLDGLRYAMPLVVAIGLKYVIGYILILIVKPLSAGAGNASIKWFKQELSESMIEILYNGWYYIIRGLSYFPIGEFVIALFFFVLVSIKNRINGIKGSIVLGILLVISMFFLSLLQGEYLHYRTAQTVQVFMAFVIYLVVKYFEDKKNLNIIVVLLLSVVSLRQSIYLHELLALNNQRSDNEAAIVQNIGYRLYSEFDTTKTVIFCGEYQLGDFIESQISIKEGSLADIVESKIRNILGHDLERKYNEFVCTNINSFFNTQMDAFNGQVMIQKYFSYYGYDINVLSNLTNEEEDKLKGYYENIAKEEGMKPYNIKDMGDYILVYLGPTIDGYTKLEY